MKLTRPLHALRDVEDLIFQWRLGCDFSGIIPREGLGFSDEKALSRATFYQPIWCRTLREFVRETLGKGMSFDHFVDLGSGKGKACLYMAKQRAFKKITGVELSDSLLAIAHANSRRAQHPEVAFLKQDASEFRLPDGNTLVFLFNPFGQESLDRFAEINTKHFERFDSVIAYANDKHRATLTNRGFKIIFRNPRRNSSLFSIRRIS